MSDSLHYIDSYFKGEFSAEERKQFEQRIIDDPSFAEEIAFYVSSIQALQSQVVQDKKENFRELYNKDKISRSGNNVRKMWYSVAAAAVITGIAFSIFLFYPSSSPVSVADKYIKENLETLGVMMNSRADSLQTGIGLYNEERLGEAARQFESILRKNPLDYKSREYAGIVFLRMKNYDKALKYFTELESDKRLHANPGKFYMGLTLLKRNLPGDVDKAKALLQAVVNEGLENDLAAKELLKKL
jgi:tetratricopeptide (TPR) repeat protein